MRQFLQLLWLGVVCLSGASVYAEESALTGRWQMLSSPYNTSFNAYIAGPVDATGGILLIHDRYGLTPRMQRWADQLARQGYRVVVPDLFDGRTVNNPPHALHVMRDIDPTWTLANLAGALDYLKNPHRKIAIIGTDYGGDFALPATAQDPTAVDAIIVYYGQPYLKIDKLRAIKSPILALFGTHDPTIAPHQITAFEEALRQAAHNAYTIAIFDSRYNFAATGIADFNSPPTMGPQADAFLAQHVPPTPPP